MPSQNTSALSCDVVALVGSPGSGKTTVAEYLATLGFTFFSISDIRRTVALATGIDPNDFEAMQQFTNDFYRVRGRGIFADFALRNIAARGLQKAVLEGLRYPESVEVTRAFCEERQWRLLCIGLSVSETVAAERIASRGRQRDPQSPEALREYTESAGRNARAALSVCDITIANDSTVAHLTQQVAKTLATAFAPKPIG